MLALVNACHGRLSGSPSLPPRAAPRSQEDTLLWSKLMFLALYYSQHVSMHSDRDRDARFFSVKCILITWQYLKIGKKKKNITNQTWNTIHCWNSSGKSRVEELCSQIQYNWSNWWPLLQMIYILLVWCHPSVNKPRQSNLTWNSIIYTKMFPLVPRSCSA